MLGISILSHFSPMWPLYRNHSIDLKCKWMNWVLYNDNSVLKGFHGTLDLLFTLLLSVWKFYTCFNRMFLFSFKTGVRVLLCPHPVFVGTFKWLKFNVLQLFLIFWCIPIFLARVRKIYFLTHFISVLP